MARTALAAVLAAAGGRGAALVALRYALPLGDRAFTTAEYRDMMLAVWLLLAVFGLVLIEQLYRNASHGERWSVKFLCLGLGAIYAYDFFMYAEALLFRQLDAVLWQARGLVAALVTPWLAIAIARNTQWRMDLYVSRHVVFHTVTLMGAGLYLLGMAVIGYFIKYLGGTWSGVLQVGFLAASGALLVSLLFSGQAARPAARVPVQALFQLPLRLPRGMAEVHPGPGAAGRQRCRGHHAHHGAAGEQSRPACCSARPRRHAATPRALAHDGTRRLPRRPWQPAGLAARQ